MNHFQPFHARKVIQLPNVDQNGWQLKRYAIIAENRVFDEKIVLAALEAAIIRLPQAGKLENSDNNHGVGFQLIHFAEVAVVSPIFYWMWGSVLANTKQMRAQWDTPTKFEDGVNKIIGCIWELEIITFEFHAWRNIMHEGIETPQSKLNQYLKHHFPINKNL